MRSIKFSLLLLITITSMAVTSCSKDDNNGTADAETFIRFTIDGTDYEFVDTASATSESLTITGTEGVRESGDFTSLGIFMPLAPVEGTYDVTDFFGEGDHKFTFTSESLEVDFTFATSGSITITSIGEEFIEGTFSGVATSNANTDVAITNGSFRGFIIQE